jgi:hypothetical protein
MITTPHPRHEAVDTPALGELPPRERWLRQEVRRVAPHLDDQPSDRGYIHALETLVHELHDRLSQAEAITLQPTAGGWPAPHQPAASERPPC